MPLHELMERRGSGMKKIVKEHKHFEKFPGYKAPEFKSNSGEFHVTLWNLNYDEKQFANSGKQFANDSKEFANDTKEFANSEKQFANDTKEAQGGDAEGVMQFFGMRSDEGYVFFSCFHS